MISKHLSVNKTARYFIYGNDTNPEQIWFVLHGYGQLADNFLENFKVLDKVQNLIIAPEGLHRFYLKGSSGNIGASWMTKEDRLNDIKDYAQYLNALYDLYHSKISAKTKINVLGFSQGAATVSRWIEQGKVKTNNLILWAGVFPPDISFQISNEKLKGLYVYMVTGNQDQYIRPEAIEKQKQILDQYKINYKILSFEGRHEIDRTTLLRLSDLLKTD